MQINKTSLALALLTLVSVFTYAFREQDVVLSSSKMDGVGEVCVVAHTDAWFPGWSFTVCWRRGSGPWMLYYLGHDEPFWKNVVIVISNERIVISRDGRKLAEIKTSDGTYAHYRGNFPHPSGLLFSEKPYKDNSRTIWPDSARWKSEWPKAIEVGQSEEAKP
jgi:hypothetical protein